MKKSKIATFVSLCNFICVQTPVASLMALGAGFPGFLSISQFVIRYFEMEASRFHIHFNDVPIAD